MECKEMVALDQQISLVDLVSRSRCTGFPFLAPKRSLRITEASLVCDVLKMVQGYPSNSFSWDEESSLFCFQDGLHLSHLSQSSLKRLLARFINASSSLRRVHSFIERVAQASCNIGPLYLQASPTLQAFASMVSLRLEQLRKAALELELVAVQGGGGTSVTLLSLIESLSWVFAGAEFLEHVVNEAIPHRHILCENGISAGELSAYILTFLHNKMSEFCLLQDGREEPYGTLIMLFAGSLQPLTELLNSWLLEGVLDDPFGELFFYKNKSVAIEDATFWQQGFHMRDFNPGKQMGDRPERVTDDGDIPSTAILDGLIVDSQNLSSNMVHLENANLVEFTDLQNKLACPNFLQHIAKSIVSAGKSLQLLQHVHHEVATDVSDKLSLDASYVLPLTSTYRSSYQSSSKQQKGGLGQERIYSSIAEASHNSSLFGTLWNQWSTHVCKDVQATPVISSNIDADILTIAIEEKKSPPFFHSPILMDPTYDKDILSLNRAIILPPLNDEDVHKAILLHAKSGDDDCSGDNIPILDTENISELHGKIRLLKGTDYADGSACGSLTVELAKINFKAMEQLFPFPTALPSFREGWNMFSSNPVKLQNKFATMLGNSLKQAELRVAPLPQILVQECLINSIQKQVDNVGKHVLNRLMGEWRLMEELFILRAVYLVGSGDLLQQFSSVLFNKLDRGEPWDDFYELNTMLQESVRSSADGLLLPALDSLVVTVQTRSSNVAEQTSGSSPIHLPGRNLTFGIDTLDNLFFVYKVAWPLELIIDKSAIKKYNQVMAFLFKVKRAKFALDKACRWMWKDGGGDAIYLKQQLLLQQKLMHFVNTLHQYIMDRVLYSAWVELCEGMASACSLDEVIACHDAYLISIQRQCLVAPDKLWALISSRVKTILSLALDFYSIQRTLCGGGAAPAIKARCQLEIERVGRQFDECIAFLLRVLSFKLNVGHFPHLAELVTRINYNFYYVSETGHLLTPLPEVSSRIRLQQARLSTHG